MHESLHRVVVTGASGFVGRALVSKLPASANRLSFAAADWRERLERAPLAGATVFHLAARVHGPTGDEQAFHDDNAGKTRALAEAAARAGARRVVYLSSIKVNGEESRGRPFGVEDPPAPEDAYGRSKLAAEQALATVAGERGLEAVVVRPPLVYGAGAGANLAALLRLLDGPWPLPFASLHAGRSFVHVEDLVNLLIACGEHPQAAGRTYVAAHRDAVSLARLAALVRKSLGRPPRLFPMPPALLEASASLLGQWEKARRLTRELRCDPSAAERDLGWTARVTIEQAVEDLVMDYRARRTA